VEFVDTQVELVQFVLLAEGSEDGFEVFDA
jgi:hypothetical protein